MLTHKRRQGKAFQNLNKRSMNLEITLHKTAIGRSKIYYWLAHLFLANPTYEDLVRALDAQLLLALEETIDGNEPAVAWLRSFAKNLDRVSADRVSQTYSELFVVPIPGKYLPPYESCLRERISESIYGEIMGNASGRVAQFYRRNGFEPTAENTPPDHVGIGLDYSGILTAEKFAQNKEKHPEIYGDYTFETRRVQGIEKPSMMHGVTEVLVGRGFSPEAVRKILGLNFLRVFEQVWRG